MKPTVILHIPMSLLRIVSNLTLFSICPSVAWSNPIVLDGSLGPGGTVRPINRRFTIKPEMGRKSGSNLYHSFSSFSVPGRHSAVFSVAPGTNTVVARVTGGELSKIDGSIVMGGPGTSLYLINPAGFIFGQGSSLDVTGSFHAISGDYIRMENGGLFWADKSRSVSLSSAPVSAFGFLDSVDPVSGILKIDSNLATSGDLGFIGRSVTLRDANVSSSGNLFIGAAGRGSIELSPAVPAFGREAATGSISIGGSRLTSGGEGATFSLRAGSVSVDASTLNYIDDTTPIPSDLRVSAAGAVTLRNGSVVAVVSGKAAAPNGILLAVGGHLFTRASSILSLATDSGNSSDIEIQAGSLEILGDGGVGITGVTTSSFTEGNAGDLRIAIRGLTRIEKGGLLGSFSLATGNAGSINLTTSKLEIAGIGEDGSASFDFLTGIVGIAQAEGQGGVISVECRESATLTNGGLIDSSTFGKGRGGNIKISSPKLIADRATSPFFTGIGTDTDAEGSAGTIHIESASIKLLNGGLISSSTAGAGDAGDIFIRSAKIVASGSGVESPFVFGTSSGLAAGSVDNGFGLPTGNGGRIEVIADIVSLHDSAALLTRTVGPGAGGAISVTASQIVLDSGAALASSSSGSGNAGEVRLAGADLRVGLHSEVSVRAAESAAGNLAVTMTGEIRISGGLITANAGGSGDAGDIEIHGRDVRIGGAEGVEVSGIVASTGLSSSGRGGNIVVAANHIAISERGRIGAESMGTGNAGSVAIAGEKSLTVSGGGQISAVTYGSGSAGNISVSARDILVSGSSNDDSSGGAQASAILASTGSASTGRGGRVNVAVSEALTIRQGALLGAGSSGAGDGGQVNVRAGSTHLSDGAMISSNATGSGRAGGIGLTTRSLVIREAEIGVSAALGAAGKLEIVSTGDIAIVSGSITANADGAGDAGNVTVRGQDIEISGKASGIRASMGRRSTGKGGDARILANGSLKLTDGALLAAESLGSGPGGSVEVRSASLDVNNSEMRVLAPRADAGTLSLDIAGGFQMRGGLLSASAGGDGGGMEIHAGGIIWLAESAVIADAKRNGGNIAFSGADHLVLDGTRVSASAVNRDGGNIFVSTGTFLANQSPLNVTSERGAPGTVSIETINDMSGGEEMRDEDLLDPDDILQPECTKRAAVTASSFTQAGRGGTKRLPGGYLPSFRSFQ